ncbi:hypothetical protein MASR1M60_17980 [Rhodocyclaceae bacterium]
MNYAEIFQRLNNREPTDAEILHFERMVSALDTTPGDALLVLLVALDHYKTLYEDVPGHIEAVAGETLGRFKAAADAQASASLAGAQQRLMQTVSSAARRLASDVAAKEKWMWLSLCFTAAAVCFCTVGFVGYQTGVTAGKAEYELQMQQKLRILQQR